jgi:hypothetical protein
MQQPDIAGLTARYRNSRIPGHSTDISELFFPQLTVRQSLHMNLSLYYMQRNDDAHLLLICAQK